MEFLRYPQLIPALFNVRVVRTSTVLYHRFILSMDRSPGFGSTARNFRPFETRFRFGSGPSVLNLAAQRNSPVRSTKSTRSHLDRAPSACKHKVSGTLSLPSRGTFHLSLTVLFAIGHQVVFSLGGWAPRLPTGFLVSCGTLDPSLSHRLSLTGLLPSPVAASTALQLRAALISLVLNPDPP